MVLTAWLGKLDAAMADHMMDAINKKTAADIELSKAKEAHQEAKDVAEDDPKDAEKKKKVEAAKKTLDAAEKAAEAAAKARDARRGSFDLHAELKKLAKGRPGLKLISIDEKKDAEAYRNLPELGKWRDSHLPGQMTFAGEIYSGRIQSTDKGPFLFQIKEIEPRPFKKFEDIEENLKNAYVADLAQKYTKEKKESFEKVLERLSREKLKTEIAELEKKSKEKIEEDFKKWKSDIEKEIASTQKLLEKLGDPSLRSYKSKAKTLAELKKRLGKADDERKAIVEKAEKDLESDIDEKLTDAHAEVLAAAGKAAGIKVETLGPYSRKLEDRPRFRYRFDPIVRAIFSDPSLSDMQKDDVIEFKDDPTNEVSFMAVCTKVEKGSLADVSRRQWLQLRQGAGMGGSFAGGQMSKAVARSFTIDALKKGYGFTPPAGAKPDRPTAGKTDKGDGDKKK